MNNTLLYLFLFKCFLSLNTNLYANSFLENQTMIKNRITDIQILSDSDFENFIHTQYDTISFLYISKDFLTKKIDLTFANFNHIKNFTLECENFEPFDSLSPKLLNNLSSLEIIIKYLDEIPQSFLGFTKLESLTINSDSSLINKINLENIFRIKSLLSFSLKPNSIIQEVSLGKYSNKFYNIISIGNTINNKSKIGYIKFDSSFFIDKTVITLTLDADEIINFYGSNTFSALKLSINSSNIQRFIYLLKLDNSKSTKELNIKYTSITLYDCSKMHKLPNNLFKWNYKYINLYDLDRINEIYIDNNTTWFLYLHIQKNNLSKAFFKSITQNKQLYLTIETNKIKYRWIKHFYRLGELKIIYPDKKAKSEWDYPEPKKLPWRVNGKLKNLNKLNKI